MYIFKFLYIKINLCKVRFSKSYLKHACRAVKPISVVVLFGLLFLSWLSVWPSKALMEVAMFKSPTSGRVVASLFCSVNTYFIYVSAQYWLHIHLQVLYLLMICPIHEAMACLSVVMVFDSKSILSDFKYCYICSLLITVYVEYIFQAFHLKTLYGINAKWYMAYGHHIVLRGTPKKLDLS